jgi:small nuclear ribonucleoprotein (snRNP)-like protein
MKTERERLASLIGCEVVLDTHSDLFYIGTLKAVDRWFYVLVSVDVHDRRESSSTKEVYLIESRKYGIKKNRDEVLVRASEVVSISRLEDVIIY